MKQLAMLLVLCISTLALGQAAADIYAAPWGNDTTGTGTFVSPYLTCNKVRTAMDALVLANGSRPTPFVAYFRGGTYFLPQGSSSHCSFTSADNGLSAAVPVVYAAYPGETPILDGGLQITGWTNNGTAACASNSCTDYSFQFASNPTYFESLFYGQTYQISSITCSAGTGTAQVSKATEFYAGEPFQITGNAAFNFFGYTAATVTTTSNTNDTVTFAAAGGACPPRITTGGNIKPTDR